MVRRLRVRAQGLCGKRRGDVYEVVRAVGAIPAQDSLAARLAVRARSERLTAADVIRACNEERSVVRTWLMRGTLHLVAAEDVRWLVGLLGPVFARAGRRRRLELGVEDGVCERALPAIGSILSASAPLTRADLVHRLAKRASGSTPGRRPPRICSPTRRTRA